MVHVLTKIIMEIITNIQEGNLLLKKYNGASVHLFFYDPTFKRLILKISLENVGKVVYLICIGCVFISGRFSWEDSNITIDIESEENEIVLTKIIDIKAGFQL